MFNQQGGFNPMTFNMMLNMMNLMYPNNGYNMNNYNMNNPQVLMNNMMNLGNMNPMVLQMYNNVLQNYNNNNNINQNINNNIINNNNNMNENNNVNRMNFVKISESDLNQVKVNGGVLNSNAANFYLDTTNPFDNSIKKNIIFSTLKEQKANVVASINMKVKDLLRMYVSKIGLGPNVIGDSLFFLFNGNKINLNEEKTIQEYGLTTGSIILVLDVKEVIGA